MTFGNNDDVRATGGGADTIQQIHAHSVDQTSALGPGCSGKRADSETGEAGDRSAVYDFAGDNRLESVVRSRPE